ncbi:hypothetical protein R3X25_14415 [Lutibacter sp. TH_r2]|uniref:tetratricopeptide repeat protein n=1 Tax=Lutibacter sp. TH_r2 TaxID=3082083 RepID=UPI0029540EBC|nr:tetratricopeptide repeat protein [Lutibacter sp. TH_r2]MDV7188480.1 hypothetical protein [Lutibacter sp. TH_r2]
MRKQVLFAAALVLSVAVFGQKNELKTAEKAVKAGDFATALTVINQAESLIGAADQKTKAKFYYLKGKALYQNGKVSDLKETAGALRQLINFENETNKQKYSSEFKEIINKLVEANRTKANTSYEKALATKAPEDYSASAKSFYNIYVLSPKDTSFLDNAALLYTLGKDYDKSIALYDDLLETGYTGIETVFTATNIESGEKLSYADKKSRDNQIKFKIAENPGVEVKETRRPSIYKNLASAYSGKNDEKKALEIVKKGREEFPTDYILLIEEANLNFKLGDEAKFKELLEKAIELNPTEPALYYNVGVMNLNQKNIEEAVINFKKAIELKPDYGDAYNNIGATILLKAEPIIEEMNKNLSNFDKYDELQAKQLEVYKEAVPYYEKAYNLDKNNIGVVQTLIGLYENLENTDKLKELKEVYEGLKQ